MGVFEHALPADWGIASPRGIFPSTRGGYSWTEGRGSTHLPAFDEAARRLNAWISDTAASLGSDPRRVVWMGFSQGAALAFAVLLRGAAVLGVASLAGFLPEDVDHLPPGPRVFWAHGRRDEDVPIARARADAERLRSFGAEVEFCDADVDHRVGAACLTALRRWLDDVGRPPAGSRLVS